MLLERRDGLRDRRALLPDRDVDALHALTALVEDRVDRNRGLAGLAVADDELTLTATDRRHGIDRLDPGLQRLVHRLAADDARRLHLETAERLRLDRTLAVDRLAEGVHDPADDRVADGDREDAPGGLDRVAFLDVFRLPEHDRTDRVLVEVEREPERSALELEQLVHRGLGESGDAGDAVADLEHAADLRRLERGRERLDVLAQRRGDLVGVDRELRHLALLSRRWPSQSCSFIWSRRWRTVPSITVSPTRATSPPRTVGSMITFTSIVLPVARPSASASRAICSSSSGIALRTSATSLLALGGGELDEPVDDRGEVGGLPGGDDHRRERRARLQCLAAHELVDDGDPAFDGQLRARPSVAVERHAAEGAPRLRSTVELGIAHARRHHDDGAAQAPSCATDSVSGGYARHRRWTALRQRARCRASS